MRQITDKPVTHVVNTHHHGDHYLGNAAFEGATIISSEMCRKMVLETAHEWLAIMEHDIGRKLPGTKPMAADVTYPADTRTETTIQGVQLVFWVPAGSHTVGDLLVQLPADKVLVAGDVLVSGIVPTLQDGFLKNWIRTLEEVQALDVEYFVPGHGDLMTLRDVTTLRASMLRFYEGVKRGSRTASMRTRFANRSISRNGRLWNGRMSSVETSTAPTLRSNQTASRTTTGKRMIASSWPNW